MREVSFASRVKETLCFFWAIGMTYYCGLGKSSILVLLSSGCEEIQS